MIEVCLNDKDWIEVNSNCVDYIYKDEMPLLVIIVDEFAELQGKDESDTPEAKEVNRMKDEIRSIINSIAQLGRSAGVHILIATQKPTAQLIGSILRSNLTFRALAGKAENTSTSEIILASSIGTSVETKPPGMSIIGNVGEKLLFTRTYFSEFKDLDEYYAKRGLDEKGYSPNEKEETEVIINDNLDGTVDIIVDTDSKEFKFDDHSVNIEQRDNQEWQEV